MPRDVAIMAEGGAMRVAFQIFKGTFKTWDTLCGEAAEFASERGKDRLINIAVSVDHSEAVLIVWYWE
jgi:hypothetical protein